MLFVNRREGEYMHLFENKLSLKKTKERRSELSIRDFATETLFSPLLCTSLKSLSRPFNDLDSPAERFSIPSVTSGSSSTCTANQLNSKSDFHTILTARSEQHPAANKIADFNSATRLHSLCPPIHFIPIHTSTLFSVHPSLHPDFLVNCGCEEQIHKSSNVATSRLVEFAERKQIDPFCC